MAEKRGLKVPYSAHLFPFLQSGFEAELTHKVLSPVSNSKRTFWTGPPSLGTPIES